MYINKVTILGNLTRDPELKSLPSGIKVVTFSIVTNRAWKDQNGAKKESAEFHNVVSFGKPAEIIAQYSRKGSLLYVEGRLQTRSWDANDGTKKYRTEIVLENFQFGPKPAIQGGEGTRVYRKDEDKAEAPKADTDIGLDSIEYPSDESNLEDIPF